MLRSYGEEPIEESEENKYIGPSIKESLVRLHGFDEKKACEGTELYRKIYVERFIGKSVAYQGMEKMLIKLKETGCILGIATMKTRPQIDRLIDLFNLGMKFFNDEKYSVAKNYFIRSVEPNSNSLADLCDLFEQDGNYEERGDKLFEIGEYKLAQGYYQKSYEFSKFAIMYLYIDSLSYEKQLKEFYNCLEKENIDFSDLYDEYSSKFDKLNDILRHKILKTEKLQSEIQEKMNSINKMMKNINSKFN